MDNIRFSQKLTTKTELENQLGQLDSDIDSYVIKWHDRLKFYSLHSNSVVIANIMGDMEDVLNVKSENKDIFLKKYEINDKDLSVYYDDRGRDYGCITVSKRLETVKHEMPYGPYLLTVKDHRVGFHKLNLLQDEYLDLQNKEINDVKKHVEAFYTKKDLYNNLKVRHKAASLLYGPPGAGKTSSILNMISTLKHLDIYTIYVPKEITLNVLNSLKECFKEHNVLIVLEEITERLRDGVEDLLNFADGYNSWENCYVIATTNYPEQIPANLIDRPGRFNYIVEFKHPTDSEKRKYLEFKGIETNEIDDIIKKTPEASLDYLSQIVLQSKLLNLNPTEYIKILYKNKEKVKRNFASGNRMGLNNKFEE